MAKRRYRYTPTDASGPDYPQLGATVAKWRAKARDGLCTLTRAEVHAYGEAVERAILVAAIRGQSRPSADSARGALREWHVTQHRRSDRRGSAQATTRSPSSVSFLCTAQSTGPRVA
jgi:hypothetical protein